MFEWLNQVPPQIVWTLLGLVAVFLAYRVTLRVLRQFTSLRKMSTPYVILRRIFRWTAIVVGAFLALQTLGVLQAAWATLTATFTLVAVGFVAMWSVLSHATCALVMMFSRPFDIGDTIEFPETPSIRGEVVDFTLLYTTLRTETGDLIQVPNNVFFQRVLKRTKGSIEISLDEQYNRDQPIERGDVS